MGYKVGVRCHSGGAFPKGPTMTRSLALALCLCLCLVSAAHAQSTFIQPLLSGASKTKGTSLALTGAVAVTAGDDIFVAFAADPGGGPYTATDNLGNSYAIQEWTTYSRSVDSLLFRAQNILGGILTQITIVGSAVVTAKAAVAGEFGGVGLGHAGLGGQSNNGYCWYIYANHADDIPAGGLAVGAAAFEESGSDTILAGVPLGTPRITNYVVGQAGTTGQGDRTNMTVALVYALAPGYDNNYQGIAFLQSGRARESSGAGGVYASQ